MSWNYRIGRKAYDGYDPEKHDPSDRYQCEIYSVYYNGTDERQVKYISMLPVPPYGSNPTELAADLRLMLAAYDKPVLNLDSLQFVDEDDVDDVVDVVDVDSPR